MEWLTSWGPPGAGIGIILLLLRYPQIIEKIFGGKNGNGNGYIKKEDCHAVQDSIKDAFKEGFGLVREDIRHLTKRVDGLYDK